MITSNEDISTEEAAEWLLRFSLALPNSSDSQGVEWFVSGWFWAAKGAREDRRLAAAAEYRKQRSELAQQQLACST